MATAVSVQGEMPGISSAEGMGPVGAGFLRAGAAGLGAGVAGLAAGLSALTAGRAFPGRGG